MQKSALPRNPGRWGLKACDLEFGVSLITPKGRTLGESLHVGFVSRAGGGGGGGGGAGISATRPRSSGVLLGEPEPAGKWGTARYQ